MELFSRRCNVSPLIIAFIFMTFFHNVLSRHRIRHYKDRFKRQQGAHLYLPGSYVTDGGDGPDSGPWLEWSEPSPCSRTCGGGVSSQYRTCTEGYTCEGPQSRHFSCNTQDCPDNEDFRSQQCSEYNNIPFEGVYHQWIPYTRAPNPCELNCMPRGERFYFRHAPTVVDGTRCNDETLDVCVLGKCQPVGCDMMLGSNTKEDLCRVCGGNGSTCNTIENTVTTRDLQVGYNDLILIRSGATNIRVEELAPSNNYLAVRNTSGHYYLNGNWRIDFPRTIDFAGCKFHYDRSPQGFAAPDILTCLGPIDESLFIVLLYQDSDVPVRYTYSLPTNVVISSDSEEYAWIFDEFTPCSKSCGGGYQFRNVTCAGRKSLNPVDSTLCNKDNEPEVRRKCNEIPCEAQWIPHPWSRCSAACGEGGIQTREILCQQISGNGYPVLIDDSECLKIQPKPPTEQQCNEGKTCAKWHTGPWKPCDHLCGEGIQTRKITCYINDENGKIKVLEDAECEAIEPRPEEIKKCNIRPCEGVDWIISEWSGCDRICGLTNETRKIHCATADGHIYPDDLCETEQKPETVRKCETSNVTCQYLWYASQWSECSVECGEGVQTRTVFCGISTADGVKKVENDKCDPSKNFETIKKCVGEKECEGEWFSGPWGKCSKSCGGGQRSKKVVCIKDNEVVDPTLCGSDKIVFSQVDCNTQPCSEDTIMPTDITQFIDESDQSTTVSYKTKKESVSTFSSDTSENLDTTTEETEILSDDEYEIVPDTNCDDGEWVDDEIPRSSELREDLEDISDTTGTEPSFSLDDLMLSDGTTIDESETFTLDSSLETGSGESKITSIATQTISNFSESTDEEGSGTEPTIVTEGGTEITEFTSENIDQSTDITISEELKTNTELTNTAESSKSVSGSGATDVSQLTTEIIGSDATTIIGSTVTSSESLLSSDSSTYSSIFDVTVESTVSGITIFTTDATATTSSSERSSEDGDITTSSSDITGSADTTVSSDTNDITVSSSVITDSTELPRSTDISESEATSDSSRSTDQTESSDQTGFTDQSGTTDQTETSDQTDTTDQSETTSEFITSDQTESSDQTITTDQTETSDKTVTTDQTITSDQTDKTQTTDSSSDETGTTSETDTTDVSGTTDLTGTSGISDSSISTSSLDLTTSTAITLGTDETVDFIGESDVGVLGQATSGSTEPSEETSEFSSSSNTKSTFFTITESTEGIPGASTISETTISSGTDLSPSEPVSTESATTEVTTEFTDSSIKLDSTTELTTVGGVTDLSGSTEQISTKSEITSEIYSTTRSAESTETTSEYTGSTELTPEFTAGSTGTGTEIDIFTSTTESGTTEGPGGTTSIIEIFKKKQRMCKRKKLRACRKSPYGCCWDNITPAEGPFDKGCPTPKTCKESKYGCCEDGLSAALGPKNAGCPSLHCNETLFGCCPDNKTPAEGNDNEGCPKPPPKCLESKYGCCKDNITEAEGPNYKGCEKEEETTEELTTEFFKSTETPEITVDCNNTTYRCCPDGITVAKGPGYQGCDLPCSNSTFGCCSDGATSAHGPSGEGCCLSSAFGCCPDNIVPARGPNLDGCGCQYSPYGCCPDNKTSARGYYNEGCGCQYTPHGCCPDNFTPANGPNYDGCLCHTFQFGCCPDGVTAARGPHQQGCGCRNTEFGCCSDEETPAFGPNMEGCGCVSSKYGCCLDGVSEAKGEQFEGCDTAPQNLQASCSLAKERGTCKNYTVKWFFDMDYGGCSRFWYGGCDGNGNRYRSKEECNQICVEPQGPDRCNLPKVSGPCEGYYPQWYYDTNQKHCVQFIYGGCLGNNNRFETREECMSLCVKDSSVDACEQPKEGGPCRGQYQKYYYDKERKQCLSFIYGGCKGNNNNFPTIEACNQKCTVSGRKKDYCSLPRAQGNCTEKLPRWYYDTPEKRCTPFYYSGCNGNQNNFNSKEACERDCPIEIEKDTCHLPAETGECANYVERWYYDTKEKVCRQFYYGGCGGNGNNFETHQRCQERCGPKKTSPPQPPQPSQPPKSPEPVQEPFTTEICLLPNEVGPCKNGIVRYYYDSSEGVCKSFTYGGCAGNRNNFQSPEECLQHCGSLQVPDTCHLPSETGECDNYVYRWYYNTTEKACQLFYYGGCGGNENNFETQQRCEERCEHKVVPLEETTSQPQPHPPQPTQSPQPLEPVEPFTIDKCFLPYDVGPCRNGMVRYHYDPSDGVCKSFTYGGCGGNGNNFQSIEECLQYCGSSQDLCTLPPVVGPCNGEYTQYYYDSFNDSCLPFTYGGCSGNFNRFQDKTSCEQECQKTKVTETPAAAPVDIAMCYQPVDAGNCTGIHISYFYDTQKGRCTSFTYTGCGGNDNRFNSEEQCERQCGAFRGQDVCNMEKDPGPCRAYNVKYYYDITTGRCEQFGYGGCQGNGNRFSSIEECEHICVTHEETKPNITNTVICQLPVDQGSCQGYHHKRWYFNDQKGECTAFIYTGCGGNFNNFKTFQSCLDFCRDLLPAVESPVESTEESVHPCQEVFDKCTTIKCAYGVEAYVDENDCNGCQCKDPCRNVVCLEGEQCAIDINRNKTSTADEDFIAICRQSNKAGVCPNIQPSDNNCERECSTDADCTLHLKCCSTGCGTACVDPTPPPEELVTQLPEFAYTEEPQEIGVQPPKVDLQVFKPEVAAPIGDQAVLRCAVTGNPNPRIKWSKDNIWIDGTQPRYRIKLDQSLQIITLHKTDSGIYLCTADNGIGKPHTNQIKLEVVDSKPRQATILDQLDEPPVVVSLNAPATLNCFALGYPFPSVTWWKDDSLIPLKNNEFEVRKDHSLLIHSVKLQNLGIYTCQAYNGVGKAASWAVTVKAKGPYHFTNPSESKYQQYIVNPQEDTTTTTSTTPHPRRYYVKHRPTPEPYVPPASYHEPSNEIIPEPVPTEADEVVIPPVHIVPIRANITSNDQKYPIGSDIQIPCEVIGYPEPQVQWYKDGVPVQPSDRIQITEISDSNTLTILNVTKADSGNYQCEARNAYSKASSTLEILIEGKYIHPSCTDNRFFANCKLIVMAKICDHRYYAKFCCRSCTEAGLLPVDGPHLPHYSKQNALTSNLV